MALRRRSPTFAGVVRAWIDHIPKSRVQPLVVGTMGQHRMSKLLELLSLRDELPRPNLIQTEHRDGRSVLRHPKCRRGVSGFVDVVEHASL
jgi:hypothetical protein